MGPHPSEPAESQAPATGAPARDPQDSRPPSFPFLSPPKAPEELGRLGGYRVLELLGEGGMGMVFLADDPRLGRRVAVKVMRPQTARYEAGRQRFLREARAAAAVQHDHVVPIYHVDEDGGVPFLVMPLLQGESLEARLRKRPRLPAAEAARVGREAAEGLAAAHAAGLVHRDVKPSNLWLEETAHGERVKVLDFGLARPLEDADGLTAAGGFVGTAGYTAPEQARGEAVDGRADLFSLGCVLYRMLTGRPPFQGKTLSAALVGVETHRPPPPHEAEPSVPKDLSDLVMRLLSKDPAGRPASARETADALRRIEPSLASATPNVGAATVAYRPAAPTASAASAPRRIPRSAVIGSLLAAGALLVLVAVAAPRLWVWLSRSPNAAAAAPTTSQPPSPNPPAAPTTPTGWKGFIDVVIYDPNDPRRQNVRLNDPDVLPLRPGDKFAVEAELDRPAYCYVLWIDADGTVDPVYPWKPPDWNSRPAEEQPVQHLRRPEASDRFYRIKESAPGMETLVLLVRDAPLPAEVDVRSLLGPVQPQTLQSLRSTVWFENGEVVKGEPGRSAADWDETKVGDPVRLTQEQIRARLGGLFPYMRAVSFADRGK